MVLNNTRTHKKMKDSSFATWIWRGSHDLLWKESAGEMGLCGFQNEALTGFPVSTFMFLWCCPEMAMPGSWSVFLKNERSYAGEERYLSPSNARHVSEGIVNVPSQPTQQLKAVTWVQTYKENTLVKNNKLLFQSKF